jgi:hypothetical protein
VVGPQWVDTAMFLGGIPGGGRRRGKPRKRWLDDMEGDLRRLELNIGEYRQWIGQNEKNM